MTIVREPLWDDAPRTRAQGAFRHLARFLASLGWAARLLALSVAMFAGLLMSRVTKLKNLPAV